MNFVPVDRELMTPAAVRTVAVLRIELENTQPLIWRRVAVSTSTSLAALHRVIQLAMGWHDHHLWAFTASGRRYGPRIFDDAQWNNKMTDAAATKLSALMAKGLTEFQYVYDMRDNWRHRIGIEGIKAGEPGKHYPALLGGERRCPPENCGGVAGYAEFLSKVSSQDHDQRQAALDWYGGHYNPDDIDEYTTATELAQLVAYQPVL